jgi:hypothetical protein
MQSSRRSDVNPMSAARTYSGRAIAVFAAIAGLALLTAGCGSASRSPSSSTTPSFQSFSSAADRFSECMRTHGVANFPDPQIVNQPGQRGIRLTVSPGLAATPEFNPAQKACRGILPVPKNVNPSQLAQQQQARAEDVLAFAKCLRSHGVPDFPDPTTQGQLTVAMITAAGVDLHAPAVLTAAKECLGASHGAITGAQVEQAVNGPQ